MNILFQTFILNSHLANMMRMKKTSRVQTHEVIFGTILPFLEISYLKQIQCLQYLQSSLLTNWRFLKEHRTVQFTKSWLYLTFHLTLKLFHLHTYLSAFILMQHLSWKSKGKWNSFSEQSGFLTVITSVRRFLKSLIQYAFVNSLSKILIKEFLLVKFPSILLANFGSRNFY